MQDAARSPVAAAVVLGLGLAVSGCGSTVTENDADGGHP
jgi:hypothetical protein